MERGIKQNNLTICNSTLQQSITNPIYNIHECIPSTSTSSSGNSDKLLVDENRYCVRSAPSTMHKTSAHSLHLDIIDGSNTIYDIPKCSLPR